MGRSVSRPHSTYAVAYIDISNLGIDEDGQFDELQAQDDYEFELEYIIEKLTKKYPSLYDCDKWLDREDHAILQNDHCYIGVSSYDFIMAVWLVSKSDHDKNRWMDTEYHGLHNAWCKRVADNFIKTVNPDLRKIGTFSNGQSVYERIKNE